MRAIHACPIMAPDALHRDAPVYTREGDMHRRRSTYTVSVFLLLILVGLTATHADAQPAWPNLDVLQNYPKPGVSCSLRGAAPQGSEKGKANALKNRYRLPTTGFEQVLLSDI